MHKIGEHWEKDDRPYIFINIPKNASTTVKAELEKHGYRRANHLGCQRLAVAIIRDPVDRYKSGYRQYKMSNGRAPFRAPPHDEHTLPQSRFLEPFRVYKMFSMDEVDKVIRLLTGKEGVYEKNNQNTSPIGVRYTDKEIREMYKEDVKLWEKVK